MYIDASTGTINVSSIEVGNGTSNSFSVIGTIYSPISGFSINFKIPFNSEELVPIKEIIASVIKPKIDVMASQLIESSQNLGSKGMVHKTVIKRKIVRR